MYSSGQKVVCVNASFSPLAFGWAHVFPRQGTVYTVRGVRNDPDPFTGQAGIGLWLEEIVNPPSPIGVEASFSAWRFRPLSDEMGKWAAVDISCRDSEVECV